MGIDYESGVGFNDVTFSRRRKPEPTLRMVTGYCNSVRCAITARAIYTRADFIEPGSYADFIPAFFKIVIIGHQFVNAD